MISASDRKKAIQLIKEAVAAGAWKELACKELGISQRTLFRWGSELTANKPEFKNPSQIVPQLADQGIT